MNTTTNQGFARTGPFKEGYQDGFTGRPQREPEGYSAAQGLEYLAAYRKGAADKLAAEQRAAQ
jgi:ribosome modulation factor